MSTWGNVNNIVHQNVEKKENLLLKTAVDRMKLHRMSSDNKFFLFEDKYRQCYKLYTLKSQSQLVKEGSFIFKQNF